MYHFKAFDMIKLRYEIKIWKKMLNKATNDKKIASAPPFEHTAPLPYTLWQQCRTLYMFSIITVNLSWIISCSDQNNQTWMLCLNRLKTIALDDIIPKFRFVQRSMLLENLLLMVRVQPKGCPIHLLSSDSSWQVTCLEPKVLPIKSCGPSIRIRAVYSYRPHWYGTLAQLHRTVQQEARTAGMHRAGVKSNGVGKSILGSLDTVVWPSLSVLALG